MSPQYSWSIIYETNKYSDIVLFMEQQTKNFTDFDMDHLFQVITDLINDLQTKHPYLSLDNESYDNMTDILLGDSPMGLDFDLTATHKFNVFSFKDSKCTVSGCR